MKNLKFFAKKYKYSVRKIVFSQKIASGNLKTNKSLSSSYVKLIFVIFTSIIDYSITMNYRDELRKSLLIKLSTTKITIKILSPAEQIHLINHISNNITPTGIGIAMSLYAGLRIGEICALKWENVSLDDRTINIKHTVSRIMNNDNSKQKTKLVLSNPKTDASRRSIPINSILLEFLIKFKKMSVSNYVISLNETFVSPRTFEYRYQYRYQKLLAEYNISPINFHALRHTFATRCVEAGVDIKTLSELLGHSNVNFTLNTYVHSSVERKRSQIEKITSLDV